MIMSSLLQSLRIACSFIVFPSRCPQLHTVPIQRLPQCNRQLVLSEFEKFAVTSNAIKRISTHFTIFKNFVKFANFYELLTYKSRILSLWLQLYSTSI